MPHELTDLEPSEVSLVFRAANSKRFLVRKAAMTSAASEIAALAERLQADNPKLSPEQARTAVMKSDPDLARRAIGGES